MIKNSQLHYVEGKNKIIKRKSKKQLFKQKANAKKEIFKTMETIAQSLLKVGFSVEDVQIHTQLSAGEIEKSRE